MTASYKTIYLAIALAFAATVAHAEGFKLDQDPSIILRELGAGTISDLGVGEIGTISRFVRGCVGEDMTLYLSGNQEIERGEISKYGTYLQVERTSLNEISIRAHPQSRKDFDDIKNIIGVVSSIANLRCDYYKSARIFDDHLIQIRSLFGYNSLTNLVNFTKENAGPEKRGENSTSSSKFDGRDDNTLNWIVSESKDPIDDSPQVIIGRQDKSSDTRLIMRCRRNTTDLYIAGSDFYIDRDDAIEVAYRIDQNNPVVRRWDISTDNKALFYPGSPIGFIKSISEGEALTVEIRYKIDRVLNFDVKGLNDVIGPLRKACNW
ncbi:MAG TPA: type VI secretion system-associated protein TagO [Geminicoccus sp.]|nr:type VI secretion system-associated protein TagO [Geminicoccus sp.]